MFWFLSNPDRHGDETDKLSAQTDGVKMSELVRSREFFLKCVVCIFLL